MLCYDKTIYKILEIKRKDRFDGSNADGRPACYGHSRFGFDASPIKVTFVNQLQSVSIVLSHSLEAGTDEQQLSLN
jgi:hypothetical protein